MSSEPLPRGLDEYDSDRENAELAARESSALLHGQNQVLKLIAQGEPLEKTLDVLLRIVEEQSPGMLASLLLMDDDGIHVHHGAAPSLPRNYMDAIDGEAIGPAAGSCGTAAYRGEQVIVADISTDPLWAKYRDVALRHGLRACWSTPIFDEDRRVLGTFAMYFKTPGRPEPRHLKQIAMATYTASIAIVKHREREALLAAEERLRLATAAGKVGIWERDIQTNRLTWGSQLKAILGHAADDEKPTYQKFLNSVHQEDLFEVKTAVERAISQGTELDIEFRVVWPDGSVHWVELRGKVEYDENGQAVRTRGIGLDVTQRKEMEEELKLRETQLIDAQRVANFGSYEWSPATGILRWSGELFRIFGLDSQKFRPSFEGYLERVHPEDRAATQQRIDDCVRRHTPFEGEERIIRPDGSVRILFSQGKWLFDDNQQAKKLVGTCLDITARRETEHSRVRLEEDLRQVQKIESVGRLAGGVAHDFNNLLTVIFGHADLCKKELPPDSDVNRHIQQILQAAERAATLTRQLLTFSRRQVIRPLVLDLNAVVNNLNKLLMRVIGEHISLRIVLGPGLGSIKADLGQLDQILMNLIVNAVDAMPKGGEIVVATANFELRERLESIPSMPQGRYVMLSVTDNGSGMDPQTMAQIFEPFFTTKAPGEGTGLGLSMVYGAVKQNNGYIGVKSEPGKGSTFNIYFPRVDQTADPIPHSEEKSMRKGSETILLVEDDDALRELTRTLLTSQGYKVLPAKNGATAIKLSQEHTEKIHLLLADVVMPEMNGPDLASRVKQQRPDIHVLFMSGYAGKLLSHQGVLAEETALLSKPFTRRELLGRVGASLEKPRSDGGTSV